MNTFRIINGITVTPNGTCLEGSVLVENGKIVSVNGSCPDSVPTVDAVGGYILPGFIDVHVHGGGDSDFMDETPEAMLTAARTHCAFGTTAMVPTTMTCPDPLLEQTISCFLSLPVRPEQAPELLGLHLEGPFFSAASKGAQPITEERKPTREYLEHILAMAKGRILRWDAAPELDGMEMFAHTMLEHGVLPAVAHTHANATRAMEAFEWGFSHVTHFYNAVTTFHKENGIVHSGVVEATYLRDDVTIELIGDGRHIPKESMLLARKIKGADNICLITDAMRAAGTQDIHSILGPRKGGTPVVVKDEVAQLTDFSSYAGSICTMDRALRTAFRDYGIPLPEVSRMLSLTPARLCGVADRKGSLEKGKDADIVIMTPELQVSRVFVRGTEVQREGLL